MRSEQSHFVCGKSFGKVFGGSFSTSRKYCGSCKTLQGAKNQNRDAITENRVLSGHLTSSTESSVLLD